MGIVSHSLHHDANGPGAASRRPVLAIEVLRRGVSYHVEYWYQAIFEDAAFDLLYRGFRKQDSDFSGLLMNQDALRIHLLDLEAPRYQIVHGLHQVEEHAR